MRIVAFHQSAFEQYNDWAAVDKKVFERLRRLITEAARTPFGGIGKPEPLKGDLKGYWSRRINDEHRLVYKVTDQQIIIVSCKYTTNSPVSVLGDSQARVQVRLAPAHLCRRSMNQPPTAAAYLDCGGLFGVRRLFRIERLSHAWRRFLFACRRHYQETWFCGRSL
jgi:toxin YoeB